MHDAAKTAGLDFVCTPFDIPCVEWLSPLVDAFKIASGDNDFAELLDRVAVSGKPVIVSTGFASIDHAIHLHSELSRRNCDHALLHCVGAYPVAPEDARLATIVELRKRISAPIGYSDHVLGIDACVTAVALGAVIVEKHLTLSHSYSDFRDHQLSAEPAEFAALRQRVDATARMVGTPRDGLIDGEALNVATVRRSLVAARDISPGETLRREDVLVVRPGDGLSASTLERLIGATAQRPIARDSLLVLDDFV